MSNVTLYTENNKVELFLNLIHSMQNVHKMFIKEKYNHHV